MQDHIPSELASQATLEIESQKSNQIFYHFKTESGEIVSDSKRVWPATRKAIQNHELEELTVRYDMLFPMTHQVIGISGFFDFFKLFTIASCLIVAGVSLLFPWVKTPYLAVLLFTGGFIYIIYLTGAGDLVELMIPGIIGVYILFKRNRLKRMGKKHYGTVTDITLFDFKETSHQTVYFSYRVPGDSEIYYGSKDIPLGKNFSKGDKILLYYDPADPNHYMVPG